VNPWHAEMCSNAGAISKSAKVSACKHPFMAPSCAIYTVWVFIAALPRKWVRAARVVVTFDACEAEQL
jgi:hypothetical protein